MGRHKTISDDEILAIARDVFLTRGHAASTREIAKLAKVSEAVLYQRFGSKDALFFAAMAPSEPDLLDLLGPKEPAGDAREWLSMTVERLAGYFEEVLPRGLQVMMHPSFDMATLARTGPALAARGLERELTGRLRAFQERRAISAASPHATARLLVGLAHDHALHRVVLSRGSPHESRLLEDLIEVIWRGLAPSRPKISGT